MVPVLEICCLPLSLLQKPLPRKSLSGPGHRDNHVEPMKKT
jgi:hypothetical protein